MRKPETFFEWYDRMGRPTLRMVLVGVLGLIGFAIAIQFMIWAVTNREPTPIPLQNILLAAIPLIPQGIDLFTRSSEKKQQAAYQYGNAMPNPHGGPEAP